MERLDDRPRARSDLTVVELDGEAVIYDERNGDLHRLNPTATMVFSFLDGSTTLEELSADISDAYGVPPEEISAQVSQLISEFADSHLLVGTEPAPSEPEHDDGG